jgi:hypothetical protein
MPDGAATVTFTITAAEMMSAQRAMRRPTKRWVAVVIVLGLVGGLLSTALGPRIADSLYIVAGTVLVLALGMLLGLPVILRRQLSRRYPQVFAEETRVSIDDAGLHTTRGPATTDVAWAGLTDYVERDGLLVIREGQLPAAVIPTRAFGGADDRGTFTTVLANHLPRALGDRGRSKPRPGTHRSDSIRRR